MKLTRPVLVAMAVAAVVVAGGAYAVFGSGKDTPGAHAGGPGGPGGGPGRGPGGPGGGAVDVVAVPVVAREFSTRIESIGTLEPHERVVLTANAADRVTGVFFEDGQRVKKGQTLLTLVNDEERAQLESAQATAANAKLVYERNQRLAAERAIAELELERSKTAYESAVASVSAVQARLRDRVVIAPFDGVLGFRQVSLGAYVSPGQPVATLIDDSKMRLEFGVPSLNANEMRRGLRIEGSTPDASGRRFSGEITSIDNAVDPVTRSIKVRATLPNVDGVLKPGMFFNVALGSSARNSLAAPEIAIIAEGPLTYVYRVNTEAQPAVAEKIQVTLGVRERGIAEVLSGLSSGDLVVTDGVLKVRPGAPVKIETARPVDPGPDGDTSLLVAGEGPSDKSSLRQ